MSWLRVVAECPAGLAGRLADTLEALDALSVSLEDAEDTPVLLAVDERASLWSRTRVHALFPETRDPESLRRAVAGMLADTALPELRMESLQDQDWVALTRTGMDARCHGQRLWVAPSWSPPPPGARHCLRLDPGLAFGTGSHPTTALCLAWLARAPRLEGARVLDFGCGSGILALAALQLGASAATAVDVDPQALAVTRDNAARNALQTGLEVMLPQALEAGRQFDLLVANILLGPLLELAPTLAGHLPPGGRLVLSGLLAEQAGPCGAQYAPWFDFEPPCCQEGWALLSGTRRPDAGAAP